MTGSGQRGFTLIEVIVAITLLSVGLLSLMQSAGGVTKMLRDGRQRTRASAIATSRLENLRRQSLGTSPNCTSLMGGSVTRSDGFTESWTVGGSGFSRSVAVDVGYRLGTASKVLTVRTTFYCR